MHTHGKKWSKISRSMIGRNENMVKNRYNALLRKLRSKSRSSANGGEIS
jgi:hypothetical protein